MTLIVVHAACVYFAAGTNGLGHAIHLSLYNRSLLLILSLFVLLFFIGHAAFWMVWRRPDHLTKAIIGDLKEHYLTAERLVPGLLVIITLPLFPSMFTSMKTLIPALQTFQWDAAFAEWDRNLHFGIDPWRLTHAVFGSASRSAL